MNGSLHVGNFFGTLVDQKAHQMHFGIVRRNGRCDILQDRGFARLGRRNDKTTLAFADRCAQINNSRSDRGSSVLKHQAFIREYRRQISKANTLANLVKRNPIHGVNALKSGKLFLRTRWTRLTGKVVTLAKVIATNGRSTHIYVFFTGKISARTQEPIAIGKHIKDAADLFKAFGFHAGSKHCLDKLCLLKALEVNLQFLSLFAKLNDL